MGKSQRGRRTMQRYQPVLTADTNPSPSSSMESPLPISVDMIEPIKALNQVSVAFQSLSIIKFPRCAILPYQLTFDQWQLYKYRKLLERRATSCSY
jgi:hypothetical protein